MGERGLYEDRAASQKALTSDPVDMEWVQITDNDAFGRVGECCFLVIRDYARLGKEAPDDALMSGFRQSDGALLVRATSPDGRHQDALVPAGGWKTVSPEEGEKAKQRFLTELSTDPERFLSIVRKLSGAVSVPDKDMPGPSRMDDRPRPSEGRPATGSGAPHPFLHLTRHYALVLDRSEQAQELIQWSTVNAELRDRIQSDAFRFWQDGHTPYVVVWGSIGYSGGMTIMAPDLPALLFDALPAVVTRTAEKGGLCAFLLGVDTAVHKQIDERLAQLQPVAGDQSRPN